MNIDINKKIVKNASLIYIYILLLICMVTTVLSLRGSTYYEPYMTNETPSYKMDSIIATLFGGIVYVATAMAIMRCEAFKAASRRKVSFFSSVLAFGVSILVIFIFNCGVVSDARAVNDVAEQFMKGDFKSYLSQGYYKAYPHQVHMAFYYILVYKLFGINNYIAFQIVNAMCVAIVVFLLQDIAYYIADDENIGKCTGVLSILLLPLFIYTTYIYGDVPGYTLAICGTYFIILFMKNENIIFILWSCILFCISYVIKENVLIFVLANIISVTLFSIYKHKWKYLVAVCIIGIVSQLGTYCLDLYCADKANIDSMPKGAPRESWIAMGMEEGICGAGGFNGDFWQVVEDYNYQYDLIKVDRTYKIIEQLKYYYSNPKVALKFYYKKYILQWNDPSFSALINVEWTSRNRKSTKLADFLLFRSGRSILDILFNISHFVIFLFATVGIKKMIKAWSLEGALILLIVFGGIVFHELLWEVKGRYALFYYVLLIPFSAIGLFSCFKLMNNYIVIKK